jgi:hypothetical protein
MSEARFNCVATTPVDYPYVRKAGVCVACGGAKDFDLVLCWPCHRSYKVEGYPASVLAKLAQANARLALEHRFKQRKASHET